jgi:hypothetical protein
MDRATKAELADLKYSWGRAYEITWEAGDFRARHRQSGALVHRASAAQLGVAIRIDYDSRGR